MFSEIPIRRIFLWSIPVHIVAVEALAFVNPWIRLLYLASAPLVAMGLYDTLQTKQAIRRNFPLLGRLRYVFESIRPEINQYFVESDIDGKPFDRRSRANIYQRAKKDLNTTPFGTQINVYQVGYEWINHAMVAKDHDGVAPPRILIGGPDCSQPYEASIFNISAMSYGSLSSNAVEALNWGAHKGEFYHNTGEGGISPYHLKHGGSLVYQLGTGYFGCRKPDGSFDPELFAERARYESVKMVEIKLSQGAKPGKGGILPAAKINAEVAHIRNVPMGQDAISPPFHSAFSTPIELLAFVARLRTLSDGKPVGFKMCVGNKYEFLAICKAMLKTRILPDFITIDGSEGGTGAAPLEFSDSIGTPMEEGLVFVHNALVGCNLRNKIRIIAAGKVTTGFHIVRALAMGADLTNSARGMMFALGCIQALQCHSNSCPTGVATQDPKLVQGLNVENKHTRVANYHRATLKSFMQILGAAGLEHPSQLRPHMVQRRVSPTEIRHLAKIHEYIAPGCLLANETIPESFAEHWHMADAENFTPLNPPPESDLQASMRMIVEPPSRSSSHQQNPQSSQS